MATRSYEQRARAQEAERTRTRIIEAVLERLAETPSEPLAIDRIAADAGVARSTVYAIFGSRAGLFDAVGRELAERSGYADLLEAKHEPDPRDYLRAGLRAATAMYVANRDVYRALRSMSQLDEAAVGGAVASMDAERAAAMKRLAGRLAKDGYLREGLSSKSAADVLWVVTSFESFDSFFTERGLSAKRTTDALIELAERALYAEPYD